MRVDHEKHLPPLMSLLSLLSVSLPSPPSSVCGGTSGLPRNQPAKFYFLYIFYAILGHRYPPPQPTYCLLQRPLPGFHFLFRCYTRFENDHGSNDDEVNNDDDKEEAFFFLGTYINTPCIGHLSLLFQELPHN